MDSPSPRSPRSNDLQATPTRHNLDELKRLTKDEVVEKVLELEHELNEFQESSKELELALEEELQELEQANYELRKTLEAREEELKISNRKVVSLTKELNDMGDDTSSKIRDYEEQIIALKQQLVSVEIANDNMESNDRMLTNKLELAHQFNNELLEKVAIIENDFDRGKKEGIEKQLYISNYQNQVKDLNEKIANLEIKLKFYENNEIESSFLSMKDILNAGPPSSTNIYKLSKGNSNMKKSDSLKKLHDLTTKSENMSKKVQNLKSSFYKSSSSSIKNLKSPSTTQLSKDPFATVSRSQQRSLSIRSRSTSTTNKENIEPKTKKIPPSPSIFDLSTQIKPHAHPNNSHSAIIIKSAMKHEQHQKHPSLANPLPSLATIDGSPSPGNIIDLNESINKHHTKRKSRRGNLFESFKSITIG